MTEPEVCYGCGRTVLAPPLRVYVSTASGPPSQVVAFCPSCTDRIDAAIVKSANRP